MKLLVLFACLASVAVASPQRFNPQSFRPRPTPSTFRVSPVRPPPGPQHHVQIVRDNREDQGNGVFRYDFAADNGIEVQASGSPGSAGQSNIQGSFRFPTPEGDIVEVTYIADENGFRANSPFLPQPPPLPAHAIEQIRFAEEQRRLRGGQNLRGPF